MPGPEWGAVLPVKPVPAGKSRLRAGVAPAAHDRLVLAIAADTVRAAVACPLVVETVVVTDDPAVAEVVVALGATAVPDRPAAGLNPAIEWGAAMAGGGGRRGVAALTADLPALRPADLASALAAAGPRGRWFVRDAGGTGTTLLAAPAGLALEPRFGPDSAAGHARSGARELVGDWPSLRRDVDTVADLVAAARLGLGPDTTAAWPLAHPPAPVRRRG